MRPIDADVFEVVTYTEFPEGYSDTFGDGVDWILEKIDRQPTIEPERKKGRWINHPEQKNIYGGVCIECSECGEKYVVQYIKDEKFCRNCGAYMEGANHD